MQPYTHFTLDERERLRVLYGEGKTIRAIAQALERSPSSISRELIRNRNKQTQQYNAWGASSLYLKRRKRCQRPCRLETDLELKAFTQERLEQFWPPEAIAAVWNLEHENRVSHTTIYSSLHKGLFQGLSAKTHLRRRGRRKYTRGATTTIKPERFLADRCEAANLRRRLGDWEGDTVMGGVGKGCLLTCVDRKSRYLLCEVLPNKSAQTVRRAFQTAFSKHSAKTLTLDNGPEFSEFRALENDLNTQIYFCDPHAPWQRGSNENTNGLIRFFFPKGSDFRLVSQEIVDHVAFLLNNRPRKCLGWLSPADIFFAKCCT